MSSIRRLLSEDQYLLISSFYENILASRADIWDVVDYTRLSFVFGHYVHEAIFYLLRPKSIWDVYLFTGVREPVSRAISHYYQLRKVTGCDLDVQSFVRDYGSSMCDEIIRAFPSLINPGNPKWLSAAEILTAFDYIYSTEDYSNTIGPVYESIGLSSRGSQSLSDRDNVRKTNLDLDIASHINSAMSVSDDIKLYSLIAPAIGQVNAGKVIADVLHAPRKREELLAPACQSDIDHDIDFDFGFFFDMMGYELHLLGEDKKIEVLNILQKKRDRFGEIIKFLQERNY